MSENKTCIDMHNSITASELTEILRMQLSALHKNPALAKVLPPLMIWGAPGLGKSTIVRKVAEEFGIGFIDVRLAQREPVDVRGLPVPDHERKCVDWFVSGEWPRDPESKGIILFDELTAADRSLQVAAYEMILDRRLGDLYSVPDNWYICGAGNRVEDSAVAMTMSSALANRFMHVELASDIDDWAAWAVSNGIHPSVIGFLRFRPECLIRQSSENLERGWPTPRSWERVSTMLGVVPGEQENILRKTVYGLVGNRAGLEFMEFHKLNAEFDDVKKMMMDAAVPVVIPAKVDRKYAFCAAMSYFIWRGKDKAESDSLLNGFYRISSKLSSDFACMTMIDCMSGAGVIPPDEAAGRLFYHPAYKSWSGIHGTAMKKHLKY